MGKTFKRQFIEHYWGGETADPKIYDWAEAELMEAIKKDESSSLPVFPEWPTDEEYEEIALRLGGNDLNDQYYAEEGARAVIELMKRKLQ